MLDKLEFAVSTNNKLKSTGQPMVERALNILPECVTVNFWLPVRLNLSWPHRFSSLAAVFVEEAGDKKHVMGAREH